MSTCCRILLVDQSDRIYRFGLERFAEVLRDPARHRFPLFAGKRVRMVNAFVEVIDRKPIRVRRMTYHLLPFDHAGQLEAEVFRRQEASRYEVWMQSKIFPFARDAGNGHGVVDARARFAARGGLWVPSKSLERGLRDVALGRVKVLRL
jgi:hypothetical protein